MVDKKDSNKKDSPGKRDNFWLLIIAGIIVVTLGALFTGNYLARVFLPPAEEIGEIAGQETSGADQLELETTEPSAPPADGDRIDNIGGSVNHDVRDRQESLNPPPTSTRQTATTEDRPGAETGEEKSTREPGEKASVDISVSRVEDAKQESPPQQEKKETQAQAQREPSPEKEEPAEAPAEKPEKTAAQPEQEPDTQPEKSVEKESAPGGEATAEKEEQKRPGPAGEETAAEDTQQTEEKKEQIFVLQLGVYENEENAERMAQKLREEFKKEVYVATIDQDGAPRYRVQMGAFSQKENAEKLGREVKLKGYRYYISTEEK